MVSLAFCSRWLCDEVKRDVRGDYLLVEPLSELGEECSSHVCMCFDAFITRVLGPCSPSDPFKDTAGPSIHVLIKMLATITLVMAPLFLDSVPVQIGKWS